MSGSRTIRFRSLWACLLVGLLLPATGAATDVQVVGVTPGVSAVVVIEQSAPITLKVGESAEEVKLLRADSDGAVLRIDGVEQALPLVAYAPGAGEIMGAETLTLAADPSGHFVADVAINGRSLRFLVDTGASLTVLSQKHARQIGLRYRHGAPARVSTANGLVQGRQVSLESVRIGRVTVRDVDAIVLDSDLAIGLLGMSFLDHFDMQRTGSTLELRRRR